MSKRISVLVALEGADEGLKRAITSAERSLGELSTAAKTSGAKAAAGIAEVNAEMEELNLTRLLASAFWLHQAPPSRFRWTCCSP